jgi:hypothetical protein
VLQLAEKKEGGRKKKNNKQARNLQNLKSGEKSPKFGSPNITSAQKRV